MKTNIIYLTNNFTVLERSVKIFAPATVSNVGPGFDIMGFALQEPGDVLILKTNNSGSIRIYNNSGMDIPDDPCKNIASVALKSLLKKLNTSQGFDMYFESKIKPGSGIGSSGASCTAAVFGANLLLGNPFTPMELIPYALEGEKMSSGSLHADNIAPALLGGFVVIRSYDPLDIIPLPVPGDLKCVVVHPFIEIKTADSRSILPVKVDLKSAVSQCGNVAGLISGIISSDYYLIYRSLKDEFAEPYRAKLIPGYLKLKDLLRENISCGCNISGSGPSVFVLTHTPEIIDEIITKMKSVYTELEIKYTIYSTGISEMGARIYE